MKYHYFICDVFTDTRFHGNQLAVLPNAAGLVTAEMQQILEGPRPPGLELSAVLRDHPRNLRAGMLLAVAQAFSGHPSTQPPQPTPF